MANSECRRTTGLLLWHTFRGRLKARVMTLSMGRFAVPLPRNMRSILCLGREQRTEQPTDVKFVKESMLGISEANEMSTCTSRAGLSAACHPVWRRYWGGRFGSREARELNSQWQIEHSANSRWGTALQ